MDSRAVRFGVCVLSAVIVFAGKVTAETEKEPYLALRTGLKCSQCHVNRTGGGGRTDFGSAWAQTALPMRSVGVKSRAINDWLSIGVDLRSMVFATVVDSIPPGTPQSGFDVNEAQLQFQARLIPNILSFYLDQTVGPRDASARELFALVEWRPANGYVKAGRFMLPFGWRLWDDGAFIRRQTGFTYQTADQGLEIGIEPGPFSWSVAVSNGNAGAAENDSDKQVTTSAGYINRHFRLAGSASHNSGTGSDRDIVGGGGGFTVGPLAVLGEVDFIWDRFDQTPSLDRDQLVAYVEGNFLARKGLNLKYTYGYHDPNTDLAEDQRIRMRFGVEAFPASFVQVSAFYTLLDDIPQVTTDIDVVSLELHLHF